MSKLSNFYNDGFGWICRPCEADLSDPKTSQGGPSRFFNEGEAESKTPLMAAARARWADSERRHLTCPRCGITELIDIS